MNTKHLLLILCMSLGIATTSSAQTLGEVLQHYWVGATKSPADFTESGFLMIRHELNMLFSSDLSMTGSIISSFNLDGVEYSCKAKISGIFTASNYKIDFKSGDIIRYDKLPYGMHWCNSWGNVTLQSDSEHNGYYILEGTIDDDCGGSNYIMFSDYLDRNFNPR